MGSTFDPELIQKVAAKLLANEAKLRAASVLLAPTVNIQRVRIFCASVQRIKPLEYIVSSWWTCKCNRLSLTLL